MEQQPRIIHLSFAGAIGEPPTLVDVTMEFSAPHASAEELERFIQWTLLNDETVRPTIAKEELDQVAPVQVFQKAIVRGPEDDTTCTICCEKFRTRKHVRRLACGHMFCAKCIEKWAVKQSSTCPTCRCSIHH